MRLRLPIALVIAAPLSVLACGGSPTESKPSSTLLELRLDQPATAGPLEFVWQQVTDSRCPEGAQCLRAGEVIATIEARSSGQEPVTAELEIPGERSAAIVQAHTLRLLAVEPYPRAGTEVARSEYRARLELIPVE